MIARIIAGFFGWALIAGLIVAGVSEIFRRRQAVDPHQAARPVAEDRTPRRDNDGIEAT